MRSRALARGAPDYFFVLLYALMQLQAGGTRSGELSLRQQRMSLPMLENLRTESARVSMCLVCRDNGLDDSWQTVHQKDGKFLPKPYDFVYLQINVTNMSREYIF